MDKRRGGATAMSEEILNLLSAIIGVGLWVLFIWFLQKKQTTILDVREELEKKLGRQVLVCDDKAAYIVDGKLISYDEALVILEDQQ